MAQHLAPQIGAVIGSRPCNKGVANCLRKSVKRASRSLPLSSCSCHSELARPLAQASVVAGAAWSCTLRV